MRKRNGYEFKTNFFFDKILKRQFFQRQNYFRKKFCQVKNFKLNVFVDVILRR